MPWILLPIMFTGALVARSVIPHSKFVAFRTFPSLLLQIPAARKMMKDPKDGSRELDSLLYPNVSYHGKQQTLPNMAFSSNLTEMSQRMIILSGLVSNGKVSPGVALARVEAYWLSLSHSAEFLGISKEDADA